MTGREQSADRGARVGAELRALAEAATPGPWEVPESIHGDPFVTAKGRGILSGGCIARASGEDYGKANSEFIAAANPATVLALLDRLEAAEALVDDFEKRARMASIEAQTEWSRRANSRARTHTAVACAWFDARAALRGALGEQGATSAEATP